MLAFALRKPVQMSLCLRIFSYNTASNTTVQIKRQIRPSSPISLDPQITLGMAKPARINSLAYLVSSECSLEHGWRSKFNPLQRTKHHAGYTPLADRNSPAIIYNEGMIYVYHCARNLCLPGCFLQTKPCNTDGATILELKTGN